MEQGFLKKITVIILLALAFNVTFYMDTHDGQLPWNSKKEYNSNRKNVKYKKYKKRYAYSNNYNRRNQKYKNIESFNDYNNKYKPDLPSHVKYRHSLGTLIFNNWMDYRKTLDFGNVTEPTVIWLNITKKGKISSAEIYKSSGSYMVDRKVLAFIKSLAPFPPLSDDYEQDKLGISLTISEKQFGTSSFR